MPDMDGFEVAERIKNRPDLAATTIMMLSSVGQADRDFLGPTYKRLGELYEARGDKQEAANYYLKFVDLWKSADAPLQPIVADVRRRLARLKDTERS